MSHSTTKLRTHISSSSAVRCRIVILWGDGWVKIKWCPTPHEACLNLVITWQLVLGDEPISKFKLNVLVRQCEVEMNKSKTLVGLPISEGSFHPHHIMQSTFGSYPQFVDDFVCSFQTKDDIPDKRECTNECVDIMNCANILEFSCVDTCK